MRSLRTRLPSWLRNPMERLGHHERGMLLVALLAVGGVWGFVKLANEVVEGETRAFDTRVLLALRQPGNPALGRGPRWLMTVMSDLTALGGYAVLSLVTLAVAGFLFVQRRRAAMWLVLGSTVTGALLSVGLKEIFARPRPAVVPRLAEVTSSSFPSGHAMLSAVVYLTLGALLARVESGFRVRAYLLSVALAVSFLVGLSRVYLGVHYPTDVLGGWTAGLVWALLCGFAARALQRRGKVEGSPG